MLTKKEIDRKLGKFIAKNLSRGHSKENIKKSLIRHGFDEKHVHKMVERNSETEFLKKYSIAAIFVLIACLFYTNIGQTSITGFVVSDEIQYNYVALNLNYNNETLKLNNAFLVRMEGIVGEEMIGFEIRIIYDNHEESSYKNIIEDGNYLTYVPYNNDLESIEISNQNKEIILEITKEEIIKK